MEIAVNQNYHFAKILCGAGNDAYHVPAIDRNYQITLHSRIHFGMQIIKMPLKIALVVIENSFDVVVLVGLLRNEAD